MLELTSDAGDGSVTMRHRDTEKVAGAIAICLDLSARHHAAGAGMFRLRLDQIVALSRDWADATGCEVASVPVALVVSVLGLLAEAESGLAVETRDQTTGPEVETHRAVAEARDLLRVSLVEVLRAA